MIALRAVAAVSAGLVLAAVPMAARQVFHGGTDTVLLSVTVTDPSGRPITDLEQSDFRVFEDNAPQDIAVFARDPQPIALSILIDASASMDSKIGVAREAASGFVQRLGPHDVAQVVAFNSEIDVRQGFTGNVAELDRAIGSIRTGGSTSLYTAMYVAISELTDVGESSGDAIRRQAIVVLSDGEDTTSLLRYEDVLDRLKRSDVTIYAIGLRDRRSTDGRPPQGGDFGLRMLSQSSGGRIFSADNASELPAIYDQIADELANQYVIGYVSKNAARDGTWRQVAVRATREGATARTRTGYFAPKGP
jgi:Ca-activated chloride channel family protein